MFILFAMAGSVVAALVIGIYLSLSVRENETPVLSDEPPDLSSAPGER